MKDVYTPATPPKAHWLILIFRASPLITSKVETCSDVWAFEVRYTAKLHFLLIFIILLEQTNLDTTRGMLLYFYIFQVIHELVNDSSNSFAQVQPQSSQLYTVYDMLLL